MKRILVGSAVAVALLSGSSAFAADLAARPYTKAPVMVDPGYNWSGFYIGVNGGYSWGRSNATVVPTSPLALDIGHDVNGGLGGAQAGYNWEIDHRWILGVEADIQGTGERGGSIDPLLAVRIGRIGITGVSNSNTSFPWFATFRGRAGILADPSLLLYVTGGLAVGEVKFNTQTTLTAQLFDGANATVGAPVTVAGATVSDNQTRVGYTVGAGIEKKFDPHWSAKLEYLYIDLGSATYFGATADETRVRFHDHVFRAGINYEFVAGPVVARY
jgi:outer membrane immunogenic protein